MKSTSVKIRAFNVGGAFEIILPNGKVILIDPCFHFYRADKAYSNVFEGGFTREDITGADYIILSHSHWDHDLDVGYLAQKFNSKVFCSVFCAEEILKYHDLCYDNLIPMYPDCKYTLEDFVLEAFQAKHNSMSDRKYEENCRIAAKVGVTNHSRLDQLGNMDSLDFILTTKNNFSILMASGQILWMDIFDVCKKKRPNMLLRQAGFQRNGQQVPPEEFAEFVTRYGAQLIIPFHQEILVKRMGQERADMYLKEVARCVTEREPGAMFVVPEAWKWYNIGIDVSFE